jgi:hypothetical protein
MAPFGRIVTARRVGQAVVDTLELWMPTYLGEIERQEGMGVDTLVRPASYTVRSSLVRFPEQQAPAVIVIVPGTAGRPRASGKGVYEAAWQVTVAVIGHGTDLASTRANADRYAAAIRAVMVQKPGLGGFAESVDWEGETYADTDESMARSKAVAAVALAVTVGGVTTRRAGPQSPLGDPFTPPASDPTVQTVHPAIVPTQEEL